MARGGPLVKEEELKSHDEFDEKRTSGKKEGGKMRRDRFGQLGIVSEVHAQHESHKQTWGARCFFGKMH